MASIRRFEDIEAWQKARQLTHAVYQYSAAGVFGTDYALRNQIRRAAVSAMSNIAEGFERGGSSEFVQFLSIAKGSVGEIEAQLYIALDQRYLSDDDFRRLLRLTGATKRLLAGFMKYLKSSEIRGLKFKAGEAGGHRGPSKGNQRPWTRD